MVILKVRGGYAGVLELVSTPSGYTFPVFTSLAASRANWGSRILAAPFSSSAPHFDLHQLWASCACAPLAHAIKKLTVNVAIIFCMRFLLVLGAQAARKSAAGARAVSVAPPDGRCHPIPQLKWLLPRP